MTVYYVNDDGSNTSPYDTYAKAAPTLAILETAVAPYGGDDEIHIGHDHLEGITTPTTYNFANGTELQPIRIISTNTTTDDFEAGANINTDGVGTDDVIIGTGATVWFGVTLTPTDDFNCGTAFTLHKFFNCTIVATNQPLRLLANAIAVEFHDCTLSSIKTDPQILLAGSRNSVLLRGCTITMASADSAEPILSIPTFSANNFVVFEDCDFSGSTSNMVLAEWSGTDRNSVYTYRRCKLPSAYTMPAIPTGSNILKVESCSGGTSTSPFLGVGGDAGNSAWKNFIGQTKTVTAQARTGGSSDGVTPFSWEMVANANVSYFSPLESPPMSVWVEPGAQTITVYTAIDTDLKDNELWMVIEHPDATAPASANHTVLSTRVDPLATGVDVTRDSGSTWSGSGTGTDGDEGQQKLVSASFNPSEAGPVIVRVYLAKASAVMYVDPKPEVA